MRLVLILVVLPAAAMLLSLLFSWLVETRQTRTVFASAQTTRLATTILEEQAPLSLGDVLLCLPRDMPRRPRDYPSIMTCEQGGWIAVAGGEALPPAAEVVDADWPEGAGWPAAFVLDPPPGTRMEFEIVGDHVEIRIAGLPERAELGPGLVRDARLIMKTADFAGRGRYLVRAELELGTPPGISQRGYVQSGEIAFRARAMLTNWFGNPPNLLLREDRIPVGGFVTFRDLKEDEPSPMNVQIIADAARRHFDVQAVNVPGPTGAILQYVGTEPLRLVPLWTDLIVKDPFVSLLSVLGGLTGLGAVVRLGRSRQPHRDQRPGTAHAPRRSRPDPD
ncbi:hypothetical protein [Paracoccus salsus]|uniref:hypothetical protein n=1 Tax=Paracoccus salsus TaxID=2911061 RepID=UPI001F19C40A|nr:hypothetical protein [Paracoccus salsus]MCF3972590.1 hypothetical protein [Paracoccus salsus]